MKIIFANSRKIVNVLVLVSSVTYTLIHSIGLHAAILYEQTLSEEVKNADLTVEGIVHEIAYHTDRKTGSPYTIITLKPVSVLTHDGMVDLGTSYQIRQFGGKLSKLLPSGKYEERYISSSVNPKYKVGESVIALLQGNGRMAGPYIYQVSTGL